jgi:tocopherol O-methyltransferase
VIVPRVDVADTAAVAAHYDELDDLYRSFWGTNLHHGYWITGNESTEEAAANLTRLVANQAGMKPGDRVCDLGCGYGAAAILWQRDFGAAVTGITISEKQFLHGRSAAAGSSNIQLLCGDALESGLPSQTFDVVTAIESSEHMPDKARFFAEAYRLLHPGGRCVVAAWLTRDHPARWVAKHLLDPICREGRLPSMASAQEYRDMLGAAGFRDIQVSDLSPQVKKTWSVCAGRIVSRFLGDPSLRRILFDPLFANRIFALTVFRIWLAYRTGSMRFGLFAARK